MKKKLLSLLLAVVMVFGEVGPAFAAELDTLLGWRASQTVGEVTVSVKAPDGVFPKGATLRVTRVESDDADAAAIDAAVDDARDGALAVARKFVYDIKVLDAAGSEVQPNLAFGKPTVMFETAAAKNDALNAEVYHIEETDGELTAEALDATTKRDKVSAETEGFSYYVVELTYEKKAFNVNNLNPVPLENVLNLLGMNIDLEKLDDWTSSDRAVADIEEAEFTKKNGEPYEALAVNFFSEGTTEITLFVDEGGEDDAVYIFSVVVALRDEQDVEGTNEPTPPPEEPEEPEEPGGDISEWDGEYTIAQPYTGSVTAEDIGFSVEVGTYDDYSFDGERRGEINNAFNQSEMFDRACYYTQFTLGDKSFKLSNCWTYAYAEDNFPTDVEGVQVMPFLNTVAADQDVNALHFNNIRFYDGALYFTYDDQRGHRLQEQYYYNSNENYYEWYDLLADHNLYTNHHDGIDLKMIYGYLIVDAEGKYGYVVTDESEPVHFEIKNLQPDPLSFSPGYSIGVSIGATKEQIAEAIMEESYLSNADNGPYTLHISGDVNTTDVSGLYKTNAYWIDYNGKEYSTLPAYQLSIPQMYLKDKDGKVVWTYQKISEDIPCYNEYGGSYTLYLIDPKDVPDSGDEEEGMEAYFLFGTDGKDEYGQTLSSEGFILSENKKLIDEYNTHKISMGAAKANGKGGYDEDPYILGLVDDSTLIDYLKNHVYTYVESQDGGYSMVKFDADRVELNEEECWNYPVEWDEMEEPFQECELCFDLYDEQGKVIGYAEAYAIALKPVSMMSVSLDMDDGAGNDAYTGALSYYMSGMEEPWSEPGELEVQAGVQNNAASQLIAFLKDEYDWRKYFSEGIPGEDFYANIEVSYMDGLPNFMEYANEGGGDSMSCLAGVQLSNKLTVSGKYDENGKPIADKVSVFQTHDLPVRLSASFNPNVAGVYNIGITPMPNNKAVRDLAVSIKTLVSPAPAKDVSFGGDTDDCTVYPAQVDTLEKLTALLDTVKAYNENETLIVPTMVIKNGDGATFTPAELLEDLAVGKTYTITYTATHKKDPTISKSVQRTLTVVAATVTFTGIDTPLTLSAGKIGNLMMALREGVSAEDNDGTSVDFTVSLPEGYTGAAGEYTVTYQAVQPVTQETITATRTLTVAAEGVGTSTTTIKLQDSNGEDFDCESFVLGKAGQGSFILRTDWDNGDEPTSEIVKVYLPRGFQVTNRTGNGGSYSWTTTGDYDEADGSVVTMTGTNAASFFDEMPITVKLEELYPALKYGYKEYVFAAQAFDSKGNPTGDCSKATFKLTCDDVLLDGTNTTLTAGKQKFTPVEIFGNQPAYTEMNNDYYRKGAKGYVIKAGKTAGVLPDPDWKVCFTLPEGLALLEKVGSHVYGAELTMKDSQGATIASDIVTPVKEKDGSYTLPLYTADRFSFAEMSGGKTYMDAVRSATTVEVELYFNSTAMNGTDAVKVNFPDAEPKAVNTAKEQVKLYNGGETAAVTGKPVAVEINNPTANATANNSVSELSLTSMLAQYDGYSNVGNGTLENTNAPIGKNLVQMIFPTLDDVTYDWYNYNTVTNSYNLYQNMTATAEYPYELSPVAVNLCGIGAVNGKPNCSIDYVVSKDGEEIATKTLSINKAFKNSSSSTEEVAFAVNRDAGEYVSKVIVKWGNGYTTMSRNWNNRTYAMNNNEVHVCAPYVSVIMAAKSAHADGTAVANDTSVQIKTTLSAQEGFTPVAKEQTVTLISQNDRVEILVYDESFGKLALRNNNNKLMAYLRTRASKTTLEETNASFIVTGELVKYIDWTKLGGYGYVDYNSVNNAQVVAYSVSENATTKGRWGDVEGTWVTDKNKVLEARMNGFAGLTLTGVIVDVSKVKFTNHQQSNKTESYICYATKPLNASNPYYEELVNKVGENGYAVPYQVGFHSDDLALTAAQDSKTYTIVDPWKPTAIGNKGGTDYILNPLAGDANQYNIDQMELVRLRVTDTDFKGDSRGYGYTNGLTYTFEPRSDSAEDQALLNLVEGVAVKSTDYYNLQSAIVTYTVKKPDGTTEERVANCNYYYQQNSQYPFIMTEKTKKYYGGEWELENYSNRFIPLELDKGEYVTKLSVTFPNDALANPQYMNSIGLVRFNPLPAVTGAGYALPTAEAEAAKLSVNAKLSYTDYKSQRVSCEKNLASDAKVYYQAITKDISDYIATVDMAVGAKKGLPVKYTFTNKVSYGETAERLGAKSTVPLGLSNMGNYTNKLGDQHNNELRPTFYYVVDEDFEYVASSVEPAGVTARFYPDVYANGDGVLAVSYGDGYQDFTTKAKTFTLSLRATIELNVNKPKSPIKEAYIDVSRDIKEAIAQRGYALAVAEGKKAVIPEEISEKFQGVQGLVETDFAPVTMADYGVQALTALPATTAYDGAYEKSENFGTMKGTADLRFGLDVEAIAKDSDLTNYNIYIPVLGAGDCVTPEETTYMQEFGNLLDGADAVQVTYSRPYTVKYTTKENVGFEGSSPEGYVLAAEVPDWSAVTGIWIHTDAVTPQKTLKCVVRFARPEKTVIGTQKGYGFAYYGYGETATGWVTGVNTFELVDYQVAIEATEVTEEIPVSGIKVVLFDQDGNAISDASGEQSRGVTDETGKATVAVPAPGSYKLHVIKEGASDLTNKGAKSDFDYTSADSDALSVDQFGQLTLGGSKLPLSSGKFGPVKVGIVTVAISADDFAIGAKSGETLTSAQAVRFANGSGKNRAGESAQLYADAEALAAVNEKMAEVVTSGETVKMPITFRFDDVGGFKPSKTVTVIIRSCGSALPTGGDLSYISAQNFTWIETSNLSAGNAKKLSFVQGYKQDGSVCSLASIKANDAQLAVINDAIAAIKAGTKVNNGESYPLTFTAGTASVTVSVTLENTGKKGRPGTSDFLTSEKTVEWAVRNGELTANKLIELANIKGVDVNGLPIAQENLSVDSLASVNAAVRGYEPGKYPVYVSYRNSETDNEYKVKVNVLVTDDFTVVFDTNGATNSGAKNVTVSDVTWGVDTVQIPTMSLTKEVGAKSSTFEGWSLTKAGAMNYEKGAVLTVDQVKKLYKNAAVDETTRVKTATLYASWRKVPGTGYIDVNITASELKGERDMSITLYQDGVPACDAISGTLTKTGYTGKFEGLDGGTYTLKLTIGRKTVEETITIAKNGIGAYSYDFKPEVVYYINYSHKNATLDDKGADTRAYVVGEAVSLPTATNNDRDLVFVGWETEGKLYKTGTTPDDIYTGDTEFTTVTLTAVWHGPCTVTYVDDKGTAPEPAKVLYGEKLELPAPEEEDAVADYTFKGWKYDGVTYAARALIGFGEANEATLTAVWKEETVTVTFNAKGGSCVQISKTLGVVSDEAYGALPTPTHPYAEFAGWYEEDGTEPITKDTTAPTADITLYAHWTGKSYNVTVNGTKQEKGAEFGTDYSYNPGEGSYDVTITIGGKPYYTAPEDGVYTIEGEAITGEVVITSAPADEMYVTLTYRFDGKVVYTTKVLKTAEYPTVTLPAKKGYTVDGWFVSEAAGAAKASGVIGDEGVTTLYAKATVKNIAYSFVDGEALIDGSNADYGKLITFPGNLVDTRVKKFVGWKGSNGVTIPKDDEYSYKMPDVDELVFTALWQQIGGLVITVKDTDGNLVPNAGVALFRYDKVIQSTSTGYAGTDLFGKAQFSGLEYGAYNVVVVSNLDETETVTTTVGQNIVKGNTDLTITVPTYKLNTVVETSDKINTVITAENLDKATNEKPAATSEGSTEVTITLKAEPAKDEDKAAIDEQVAKDTAEGNTQVQMADYVDLTVSKTTQKYDAAGNAYGGPVTALIPTTAEYQEITIELSKGLYKKLAEIDGSAENVLIYRLHGNQVNKFKKVKESDKNSANFECYWVKTVEGTEYIVIKAKNFSTYAIGYQSEPVEEEEVNSNPTGGGGGGAATYAVSAESTANGKVSVDKKSAAAGATVTVTVTPDNGYKLGTLTAKDAKGNVLTLTKVNDTTYTFKMPASKVTISVLFPAVGVCPQDETCVYAKFTDANTRAWYHDGVHYCVENGMMNGVAETLFAPSGTLTRGMVVTVLWRLENSPVVNYAMSFTDVPAGQWYTEAVRWAQSVKVVEGYDADSYGPNDAVTREQLATILYRYALLKGIDVNKFTENTNTLSYEDVFTIHNWAASGMHFCIAAGVVGGDNNGMLNPRNTATRAEAAAMFQRFCENVIK